MIQLIEGRSCPKECICTEPHGWPWEAAESLGQGSGVRRPGCSPWLGLTSWVVAKESPSCPLGRAMQIKCLLTALVDSWLL